MKLPVLILAATIGLALPAFPAFAQTPSPEPAAPAAAAAAPQAAAPAEPDSMPEDGKGAVKAIREACRDQIKGQGLKGEDRMKAISACVVKQRPDLAQREGCRMTGWEKGLRKQDLKGFVKDCVGAKG